MVVAQLVGFVLLLAASVSSSISMNFQKLAQLETWYEDPRNRLLKRNVPLETPVCLRPLFCVAIVLSAAASMLDFVALAWLPTAVIGVFGSLSIIINLCVTRIILFETPSKEEARAILYVVVGCLLAIASTSENVSELTPPQLLERPLSCVYIVLNWVVFVLAAVVLETVTITPGISQVGFPFIGGALGAQNVCMGKYIAYAVVSAHEAKELTVRVDVLMATLLLCVASVIVHLVWLNKGLKKYDAYYCIIVYQSAWFIFTTLSGIIVYDNMATVTVGGWVFFTVGITSIVFGVWKVSVLHLNKA
jgi:hypothetical protein